MISLLRALPLLALVGLTACGSAPPRQFEFDAIDVNENPRPCLVVVNDDWVAAAANNQYVNLAGDDALVLSIEFHSSEVEVIMAPILTEGGKPTRVPKSRKEAREYSGYVDESRKLMVGDPRRVYFILPKRSAGS